MENREKYLISVFDNKNVDYLANELSKRIIGKQNINIVCIGTDMCIGDSLGPLVGSILSDSFALKNVKVIGTLEDPVHAMNIDEKVQEIDEDAFVIAIDACIGDGTDYIEIVDKALSPGKGIGKKLTPIGNVSVLGVLYDKKEEIDFFSSRVRMGNVYFMAKVISQSVVKAFKISNSIMDNVAIEQIGEKE